MPVLSLGADGTNELLDPEQPAANSISPRTLHFHIPFQIKATIDEKDHYTLLFFTLGAWRLCPGTSERCLC